MMRRLCDNPNCKNEVQKDSPVSVHIRGSLASFLGIESWEELEFCSLDCAIEALIGFSDKIKKEVEGQ